MWFVAFASWCGVMASSFVDGHTLVSDPVVGHVAWMSLVFFFGATFAALRGLLARREPVESSHRRWPESALGFVQFASLSGILVSLMLYFVTRGERTALSLGITPTVFGAVFISATRARRSPSIHRLAVVTITAVIAWPVVRVVHLITAIPRELAGTFQVLAAGMTLAALIAMVCARLLSDEPAGPQPPPRAVAKIQHD